MPVGAFGDKLKNIDRRDLFLRLAKGQRALVRLVGGYAYEGKHFLDYTDETTGEKKSRVEECPKINNDTICAVCDKYYEAIKPVRELKKQQKDSTSDEEKAKLEFQIKKIQKQASPYKVKITFYYPVLKRALTDSEKPEAVIFQTSLQVRQRFDEFLEMGYNLPDYDFNVFCNGVLPNYYIVDRQDKGEKPLSDEEKKLIEEAKTLDLQSLVSAKKGSSATSLDEDDESSHHDVSPKQETMDDSSGDIPF